MRCGRLPRRFVDDVLVKETIDRAESADAPSSAEAVLGHWYFQTWQWQSSVWTWPQIFGRQYEDHAEYQCPDSRQWTLPGLWNYQAMANNHQSNANDLSQELRQMMRTIERKTSEKTMLTFEGSKLVPFSIFVWKYEDVDDFFEMNRLLRIACTTPVKFVVWRSFSSSAVLN